MMLAPTHSGITTAALDTHWFFSDGGRAEAGFKGTTGDCVTRAIAIATGVPYSKVYEDIQALGKKERACRHRGTGRPLPRSNARLGVHRKTYQVYLESLGWVWTPTMKIGSGCKVHLRREELPPGRLVVSLSRHLAAVIDGVIYDNHDSSRGGTRCVYGYYSKG
jgi:hypothetical protein